MGERSLRFEKLSSPFLPSSLDVSTYTLWSLPEGPNRRYLLLRFGCWLSFALSLRPLSHPSLSLDKTDKSNYVVLQQARTTSIYRPRPRSKTSNTISTYIHNPGFHPR